MDFIFAVILFAVIGVGNSVLLPQEIRAVAPNAGIHALQRTGSRLVSRVNGVKTEDVTYTCKNCGHTIIRPQQSYDKRLSQQRGWRRRSVHRRIRGGGFGGSGGGFSGGSFGGGMGGGGGAGSRF